MSANHRMDRPGSIVESTREDSYLVSIMNDDPPQPKISFLRTKRFWFRRAVPGLLLALWVEGMFFDQGAGVIYWTSASMTNSYLYVNEGQAHLDLFRTYSNDIGPKGSKWTNPTFHFEWHPELKLWARPCIQFNKDAGREESFERLLSITIPLWLPSSSGCSSRTSGPDI